MPLTDPTYVFTWRNSAIIITRAILATRADDIAATGIAEAAAMVAAVTASMRIQIPAQW